MGLSMDKKMGEEFGKQTSVKQTDFST